MSDRPGRRRLLPSIVAWDRPRRAPRRSRADRTVQRLAFAALALIGVAVTSLVHRRADAGLPERALVKRVIDGDTVELDDGLRVRYIGVDTPEMRHREGGQWVKDPEPYAQAATDANRQLVEGKPVRLEYDVQTHDRYGRLLAYVYVEQRMINEALVSDGFAQPMTIPPNVKYAERFRELSAQARDAKRGLWADPPKKRRR